MPGPICGSTVDEVDRVFKTQKVSYSPAKISTYAERLSLLGQMEKLLRENYNELSDAIEADFGSRSRDHILTADIFPPLLHIAHVKNHLKKWMKPQRRSSGALGLMGVRSYVINEPLGVVGVMSAFNAPVALSLDPASQALAAGNRVMIKPSELTPSTSGLLQQLVAKYFDESMLAVVNGGPDISEHFCALPWDKFLFIGGSDTGRKVLSAAAPNLTPVILELGGKCPAVVLPDANIQQVGAKIAQGRLANAGQVCLDVDYAVVHETVLEKFIDAVIAKNNSDFPTVQNNREVSALIDQRSYDRVLGYITEARRLGFRVIQPDIYDHEVLDQSARQLPLTIVVNPDERLQLHRDEVFGPILSVYTYRKLDHAIDIVNDQSKPLALYVFGKDRKAIHRVTTETSSGGVTINDLALHAFSNSMSFGGVGPSGMGRYMGGLLGYEAFTNPKAVAKQSRVLARYSGSVVPPFKGAWQRNALLRLAGLPHSNPGADP